MPRSLEERMAPEGTVWVCAACGKTAEDQYGIEGKRSAGWDESCTLKAVLCHAKDGIEAGRRLEPGQIAEPVEKGQAELDKGGSVGSA